MIIHVVKLRYPKPKSQTEKTKV